MPKNYPINFIIGNHWYQNYHFFFTAVHGYQSNPKVNHEQSYPKVKFLGSKSWLKGGCYFFNYHGYFQAPYKKIKADRKAFRKLLQLPIFGRWSHPQKIFLPRQAGCLGPFFNLAICRICKESNHLPTSKTKFYQLTHIKI